MSWSDLPLVVEHVGTVLGRIEAAMCAACVAAEAVVDNDAVFNWGVVEEISQEVQCTPRRRVLHAHNSSTRQRVSYAMGRTLNQQADNSILCK